MIYRKLKRTWQNGYANYIPNFKETFPELKRVDSEELCMRLAKLKMDFYYEEPTKTRLWVRFTLPFALVLFALMFLFLPINFIIKGCWGYSLGKNNKILNWFKILKLTR